MSRSLDEITGGRVNFGLENPFSDLEQPLSDPVSDKFELKRSKLPSFAELKRV